MPHRNAEDDGFSVVELIIAMFLLAVLALAVLPLLIGATRTSVVNKSLVAATTFANSQLAPIRASFPNDAINTTCAALQEYQASGTQDPAGTGLKADVVVGPCAAPMPALVTVTVTVYKESSPSAPPVTLVTLPTKVLVAVAP